MTTSRMMFGIALCFAPVVTMGCGSKPESPPAPTSMLEPDPKPGDPPTAPVAQNPVGEGAKAQAPKIPWELDADKQVAPAAPVRGSIAGVDVTPEVSVTSDELVFRLTKPGAPVPERSVSIKFAPPAGQQALGRNWKVKGGDEPGPNVPEVWLEVQGQPIHLHPSGYAMTLELGARKDGKVNGKVYISLPDKDQTVLAGTFAADYVRPHTEKPGPDDAPYVAGEVAVIGAPQGAEVRVAYAAFLPAGTVTFKELQLAFDSLPIEQARWTSDNEKPRSSTLLPGDGKARPFRYEHVKLAPGRYLLSAAITGGPAVWKWVDVPATGTLAENFTLDVSKTGGLEVTAPQGATGKVFIAPADEPARPPLEARLFEGISVQVVRTEVEVIGGKAIVKNLGAGRYEVRLGDERRTVEIIPGKTAEVNMTPAKK
ncbi:hypothetical protein J8F10_31650 [Gemmata sp. G18]|uniref:Lipoprotein n=1 Tax=Gemmata palustris TaxID=2822762 RepID=A0ABS5C1I0_9BACT|nr:hypothetical protein [Gemmata palustris]MBP3959826.1 hypothetical protein [Gemmata palustris]